LDAVAGQGTAVVDLICSAFLCADTVLVGIEPTVAITVGSNGVVGRVDGASDTVSVADKVSCRALLALSSHQTKSSHTDASASLSLVDRVLTTDKDASL
jgi:hypothetical protein